MHSNTDNIDANLPPLSPSGENLARENPDFPKVTRYRDMIFHADNSTSQRAFEEVLDQMHHLSTKNRLPTSVQIIIELVRNRTQNNQITLFVYDKYALDDARGFCVLSPDGKNEIHLCSKIHPGLLNLFELSLHEMTHAVLPLAGLGLDATSSVIDAAFAASFRKAICTDYWEYNAKRHTYVPVQKKAAERIFYTSISGYEKYELLREQMANTLQVMHDPKVARSVARNSSAALENYIKYVRETPVVAEPFIEKNTDILHCKNRADKVPYHKATQQPNALLKLANPKAPALVSMAETPTTPWRPGLSDPRHAPFYQQINYNGVFQNLLRIATPGLMLWRYHSEIKQNPQRSRLGNALAVTTETGLNLGGYLALSKAGAGTLPAAATLIGLNLYCDIAKIACDRPAEFIREDFELYKAIIFAGNYPPAVTMQYLEDFKKGKEYTRILNQNTVAVTFTPGYMLAVPRDMIIEAGRVTGDFIKNEWNSTFKFLNATFPVVEALFPAMAKPAAPDSVENKVQPQISISCLNKRSHLIDEKQETTAPNLPKKSGSFPPLEEVMRPAPFILPEMQIKTLGSYPKGFSLIDISESNITFSISKDAGFLSPEFHDFLSNPMANNESDNDKKPSLSNATARKIPPIPLKPLGTPLASSIELVTVKNGIGLIAQLPGGEGTVKVTASAGEFAVAYKAASVGELFTPFAGICLAAGALIVGALFTMQHYAQKKAKHIQKKVNKGIEVSNANSKAISDAASQISEKINAFNNPEEGKPAITEAELIALIDNLFDSISSNKKEEVKQGRYARGHHNRKAGDAHFAVLRNNEATQQNLKALKTALTLSDEQKKFINDNDKKTPEELVKLAQELTSKTAFTERDISEIEGLRFILVNKIIHLSGSGKIKEAQDLIKNTAAFQYHLPGELGLITFGEGFGVMDSKTKTSLTAINDAVDDINTCIGSGGDPKVLLAQLENAINKIYIPQMEREQSERRDNKHADYDYVSKEQWEARIKALKNLVTAIGDLQKDFVNGNNPLDFKLDEFSDVLTALSASDKPAAFWLEVLNSTSIEQKNLSENDLLKQAIASGHLSNEAIQHILQGKFDNAEPLLNELIKYHPDSVFLKNLKMAIPVLTPLYGQDNQTLIEQLPENLPADDVSIEGSVKTFLQEWIMMNVLSAVSKQQWEEAIHDLQEVLEKNPEKKELYLGLIAEITHGQNNQDQNPEFWLESRKTSLAKESDIEEKKDSIHAMKDLIETVSLSSCVNEKARLGYYREAADILQKLEPIDPKLTSELGGSDRRDDLYFQHNGQIIGIFKSLFEDILKRRIQDWQPSYLRWTALKLLELINTAEIVLPNMVTLPLQAALKLPAISVQILQNMLNQDITKEESPLPGADAQNMPLQIFFDNMAVVERVAAQMWPNLSKTLDFRNPEFFKFTPSTYDGSIYNGAIIYMKIIEKIMKNLPLAKISSTIYGYLPLSKLPSFEALPSAEAMLNNVRNGIGLTLKTISIANTLSQLHFASRARGGLFLPTSTPSNLATIANLSLDASFSAYEYYKNSWGEAIEDPAWYRNKEYMSSAIKTAGVCTFVGMITGGLALPVLAGAAYAYNAWDNEEERLDNAKEKALIASMHNIQNYRLLQAIAAYLDGCRIHIISRKLNQDDIHKINTGSDIFIRKKRVRYGAGQTRYMDVGYVLYYLDLQNNASDVHVFRSNPLPKIDWNQNIVLENDALAAVRTHAKKAIFSTKSNITGYTGKYRYSLINGLPDDAKIKAIIQGNEICFSKEENNSDPRFFLYIKDQVIGYKKMEILDNHCISELKQSSCQYISADSPKIYAKVFDFATKKVIETLLDQSFTNIKTLLTNKTYAKTKSEPVKRAMILHFEHVMQDFYEKKQFEALIKWSDVNLWCMDYITAKDHEVWIGVYALPPHLVWQSLLDFRLLAFTQSRKFLMQFKSEYNQYHQYIKNSPDQAENWHAMHQEAINTRLDSLLQIAFQAFLVAADKAENPKRQRKYLSQIAESRFKNKSLKFWTAVRYHNLGNREKCKSFLDNIDDLEAFILDTNETDFREAALVMLESIDLKKYEPLKKQLFARNADASTEYNKSVPAIQYLGTNQVIVPAIEEALPARQVSRLLQVSKSFGQFFQPGFDERTAMIFLMEGNVNALKKPIARDASLLFKGYQEITTPEGQTYFNVSLYQLMTLLWDDHMTNQIMGLDSVLGWLNDNNYEAIIAHN